jgi:hypothetical protein
MFCIFQMYSNRIFDQSQKVRKLKTHISSPFSTLDVTQYLRWRNDIHHNDNLPIDIQRYWLHSNTGHNAMLSVRFL